jgi:hypothetical protein
LLQEFNDTSVIAGISTVGGFWTVFNGTFVFLFGANVLYFLFGMPRHLFIVSLIYELPAGRRPLSSLGLLHQFQGCSLRDKLREDFPAIYSEGGQPGTEAAGMVAFIRER